MATTAGKLATELGLQPEQVLQACRQAGVTVLGEQTPLDDRETARIQAVLRVPPQQWPAPGMLTGAPPPPTGPPLPFNVPEPPRGSKQIPAAVVAALVVAVLAVIVLLGVVVSGSPEEEADPLAAPATSAPSASTATTGTTATTVPPAPIVGLATGECWNDPAVTDLRGESSGETVEVPCAEPHQAEVYALVYHPAPQDAPYPGDDALFEFGDDQCAIRFQGFVGRNLDESLLNVMVSYPIERGWLFEDRTIICSVYALDGSMLTGSVAGSGR